MRNVPLLLGCLLGLGCGSAYHGDPFRATSFAPPSITMLTPNSVPQNSVPFAMTVVGTNFGADAVVFWNGAAQHTLSVTSTQVRLPSRQQILCFPV